VGRAEQKSPAPRRLVVVAAAATGLALAVAGCSAGQVTQTDTQVAAVNGASGGVGAIAVRDAQFRFPVAEGHYREGDDAPVIVAIANNDPLQADKLLSVTSDGSRGNAEITGDVDLEPGTAIAAGSDQDDESGQGSTTTPKSSASSPTGSASSTSSASSPTSGAPTTTTTPTTTTGSQSGSASSSRSTPTAGQGGVSSVFPTTPGNKPSSSADITGEPGRVAIVLKDLTRDLRPGQTIRVTFLFEKAGPLTLELPIGASPDPRSEPSSGH